MIQTRTCVVRFDGLGDWIATVPLIGALYEGGGAKSVSCVGNPPAELFDTWFPDMQCISLGAVTPLGDRRELGFRFARFTASRLPGRLLVDSRLNRVEDRFDLAVAPRIRSGVQTWDGHVAQRLSKRVVALVPGPDRLELRYSQHGCEICLCEPEALDAGHARQISDSFVSALGLQAFDSSVLRQRSSAIARDSGGVVIHAGAGHDRRLWPARRWAQIIEYISAELKVPVTVIEGPQDSKMTREIAAHSSQPFHILSKPLSVISGHLAHAELFVGTDSGPKHIASALNVPVIEISCHPASGSAQHPQAPERFGAWSTESVILQPTEGNESCIDSCLGSQSCCIEKVSVREVQDAIAAKF